MKTTILAALAALTLAACGSTPSTAGGEHCVLPVKRNAGMGVVVDGCAAWEFGPSRTQRERFNVAHGLPKDAK